MADAGIGSYSSCFEHDDSREKTAKNIKSFLINLFLFQILPTL
jgi:hypothetical protein